LTLAGHPLASGTAEEGVAPSSESFEYIVQDHEPHCGVGMDPGDFEEYRNIHPEFIED